MVHRIRSVRRHGRSRPNCLRCPYREWSIRWRVCGAGCGGDRHRRSRPRTRFEAGAPVTFFSDIEKAIERMFHRSTEKMFGKAEADDLLLVHREILRNVETRIERAQRDKPMFPYNHLTVRLSTPDEHRRATYSACFAQDARLDSDLRELLQRAGCELPRGFTVDIEINDAPEPGLDISYDVQASAPKLAQAPARLQVTK